MSRMSFVTMDAVKQVPSFDEIRSGHANSPELLVIAVGADTPSYLLKRGRDQQAAHIVDRLEVPSNAPTTLAALHAERDGDKAEWNELWRPRRPVVASSRDALCDQVCARNQR